MNEADGGFKRPNDEGQAAEEVTGLKEGRELMLRRRF